MEIGSTAGYRVTQVTEPEAGQSFPVQVFYPSNAPERPERLDRFVENVARSGPVAAGVYPLVVVSHGSGGTPLVYRTLAADLARHGFVVVLPEHPGNHRNDNTLAGTHTLLENRPRQLRATLDATFADPTLGPHLVSESAAVIGHSLGGYTALALAGGRPTAFAHETPDHQPRAVSVVLDPRVRALVLLAPATPWFMAPGALAEVRVPILMRTGELDPITPAWHGEIVRNGLPAGTGLDHRVVQNGGHFSFLSPFPPDLVTPAFAPSQDPPGFDRTRFHAELYAEIRGFLRQHFGAKGY